MKLMLSCVLLLSGASVHAADLDGAAISQLLEQLPANQLNSLCSPSSDATVSQLCADQASGLRDRLLQGEALNVQHMQDQATQVFNGSLLPLMKALQGGTSGSPLPSK